MKGIVWGIAYVDLGAVSREYNGNVLGIKPVDGNLNVISIADREEMEVFREECDVSNLGAG